MHNRFPVLALAAAFAAAGVQAQDAAPIKHIMLISIDGMHAVDFKNCSQGVAGVNDGKPYCPNLAALSRRGVTYVNASTSKPSDSFPGLMSIVSGASPRTMGVYYDVAYDRSLDGPAVTTGNGNAAAPCDATKPPTGYTTEYEEGIDLDQTQLNGGTPGAKLIDGTAAALDYTKMDRDPARGCAPVSPTDFVRTNSIFGLVHKAGGYVAWSDKHPAYVSVAGHGGLLDDFYAPEINSNVVPLPGVKTPDGIDCSAVPDGAADLTSWTNSFVNVKCYDTLKVNAVVNWINGKSHLGDKSTRTPNLFGMNFQSVSVAQKLIENGVKGGYLDAEATPSDAVFSAVGYVDDSIGEMVKNLESRNLLDSTLIIITAKHGQSPIDPNAFIEKKHGAIQITTTPATLISDQMNAAMPPSEDPNGPGIGSTEDDVSLIWLTKPSYTDAAVKLLEANRTAWGGGAIFYGRSVALSYNDPTRDPRTPDIIVTPTPGVVYTGSSGKQEEHGGFAHDDTNVMLLVANPALKQRTVYSEVQTMQVAPTVMSVLGLDPNKLDGVRLEGTAGLPDLTWNGNE
ncbi:alkaline phosphatase family protein [Acidobacteria bacterium AB60]|nr:alkaline phosphatase family protein [Acidobacteria bacterium AB60]